MDVKKLSPLIKNLVQQFINREYTDCKDDQIVLWVLVLDTHQCLREMGINPEPIEHIIHSFHRSPERSTILAFYSELPHNHEIYPSLIREAGTYITEFEF